MIKKLMLSKNETKKRKKEEKEEKNEVNKKKIRQKYHKVI